MKHVLFLALAMLLAFSATVQAQDNADKEAVRQAVLDYVEGIYNVEPARIERSVHPDLAKLGFSRRRAETAYGPGGKMTFQQLVDIAKTYNKEGRLPKDAPKEIVIYEVLDQTATVKLTAVWGIDYMHLAKFDGQWKIVNVMWQSYPKKN
jgi:Putative lumazine-binding